MSRKKFIPFGNLFPLAVVLTLCGLVIVEIPEMLLVSELYANSADYPSALQFVLDPIYFGGFILVLPLVSALPYTSLFVSRIQTGNWYYAMIRCGKGKYLRSELVNAFLQSGSSITFGFILYVIFCNLVFLPSNPQQYISHVLPFEETVYEQMYQTAGGLFMYVYLSVAIFFCAGCWSLVSLATAVWMPDSLIAITAPMIFYYIWLWGGIRQTWLITSISPTALFNDQLSLAKLLMGTAQYVVLGLCSVVFFTIGAKRRIGNAQ